MHHSAMLNGKCFFDTYAKAFDPKMPLKIVEIGSQDVNGSLRQVAPEGFEYLGIDFVEGKGVDIVLSDPYQLPVDDESADIVVSSSCFEHSEMFWIVFLEIMRVLKPKGLFYLNVPSNGNFHRYPVDCWRFYPDSGRALVTWAKRNGVNAALLESYVSAQTEDAGGLWNDFVGVFLKDEQYAPEFNSRILDSKTDIRNGTLYGKAELVNPAELPEDKLKLEVISQVVANRIRVC
jgi:SAM-dependent methyltransferase